MSRINPESQVNSRVLVNDEAIEHIKATLMHGAELSSRTLVNGRARVLSQSEDGSDGFTGFNLSIPSSLDNLEIANEWRNKRQEGANKIEIINDDTGVSVILRKANVVNKLEADFEQDAELEIEFVGIRDNVLV